MENKIQNEIINPSSQIYYITEILKNYGYNDNFENKVDFAVEIDRFDLIKYLHSKGYKGTKDAIAYAAENGHLEIIKYLHELGYKGNKLAINNAAENGHLEVLKYLHELGYKGYKGTKNAINNAVVDGYLDVVKYLISLNYKVNETDFMCAVFNEHLEILKYFIEDLNLRGPENLIKYAFSNLMRRENSHLEVVKYLHEKGYK
ncbi:alpha-latrotoxin-Lt1a-like [Hydra vulgaris]|uniref:alpha-latrotoxin-Lt1a-like n=1 Tax=Hydra vulgaris TaxID=6087 RepID=UPI0032EA4941